MKKRNTPTKQMILGLLQHSPTAMSQDMLEAQMAGNADRVTIYRVLNGFCEDGIVHRVVSDEGKAYYALCGRQCMEHKHRHDHAHFKCLKCQQVECLPAAVKVTLPEGYTLQNMNYWISGYCKACSVLV